MKSSRGNEVLVASGLVELALGALAGWPYALAVDDPRAAERLGVRSPARLRQWHLDLIALGALSVLVGSAVPRLPRWVAIPLGVGAWTNANAFGVLVVRPDWKGHAAYRAGVVASFAMASFGCVGLAGVGIRRLLRSS